MTGPDPRLAAAARLREHAAWLGDLLVNDALATPEARAGAFRAVCEHVATATELEAAVEAERVPSASPPPPEPPRDLRALFGLDRPRHFPPGACPT